MSTVNCGRCNTPMLHSHIQEVEEVGPYELTTEVFISECPVCSCVIKVIVPLLPEQRKVA